MQPIESFTAIATILGRQRRVRHDVLGGLVLEGLAPNEAKLVCLILDRLDDKSVAALAQGIPLTPASSPTMPDGAPNEARWRPSAPRPPAEPPDTAAVDSEPPAEPPEPAVAPVGPPEPTEAAQEDVVASVEHTPDTSAERAREEPEEPAPARVEPVPVAGEIEARPAEPPKPTVEEVTPQEPKPKPSRRKRNSGPKKPPPRVKELTKVELPAKGDAHEGVPIVEHVDHGDGGRMIVRADGWHIKLDKGGKEVARIEGLPPDVSDVKTADEMAEAQSSSKSGETYPVPDKILATRMTREVVQHLVDHGITTPDAIVAECVKLKTAGAKAFENSKDEEAVKRRVNSTLAIMGRK